MLLQLWLSLPVGGRQHIFISEIKLGRILGSLLSLLLLLFLLFELLHELIVLVDGREILAVARRLCLALPCHLAIQSEQSFIVLGVATYVGSKQVLSERLDDLA